MANSIVQPFHGSLILNLQHLEGIVIDAIAGATRGLRRQKQGIEKVLHELQHNIQSHASTLGIAPDAYDRIANLTDQLTKIREARVHVSKLDEVLMETEAFLEDEREGQIGLVVEAARRAAIRRDPTIVALFEETIRYYGQIALRAHKTRRKKEHQAEAETKPATPATPAAPATPTAPATKPASTPTSAQQ